MGDYKGDNDLNHEGAKDVGGQSPDFLTKATGDYNIIYKLYII